MRTNHTVTFTNRCHHLGQEARSGRSPVAKVTTMVALLGGLLFVCEPAHAVLVDGDFGSGGSVSIINNNNYTAAQAGSWGTNTGGAWEVISADGNPPDSAAFTLTNDNPRVLIQAVEDNFETIGPGFLRFDINFLDNGTDLSFQYDVYGWDGVGTWVNNSFATVPGTTQLLAADSLPVAGSTSGGWTTHVDSSIDFGSGFPYLVVRFEGANVNGDVLRLDNIELAGIFVPEPSSLVLLGLGMLLMGYSRRRKGATVGPAAGFAPRKA